MQRSQQNQGDELKKKIKGTFSKLAWELKKKIKGTLSRFATRKLLNPPSEQNKTVQNKKSIQETFTAQRKKSPGRARHQSAESSLESLPQKL